MKKLFVFFFLFFSSTLFAETILKPLEGKDIPLSTLKGKWVFINFWAEWCHTCLSEIPELNRFYQNNKDNTVAVFGVNFDKLSPNQQKQVIKRTKIQYPALLGNPAYDLRLGLIPGLPVTFVLNPEGKLAHTLYGKQSTEDLEAIME